MGEPCTTEFSEARQVAAAGGGSPAAQKPIAATPAPVAAGVASAAAPMTAGVPSAAVPSAAYFPTSVKAWALSFLASRNEFRFGLQSLFGFGPFQWEAESVDFCLTNLLRK